MDKICDCAHCGVGDCRSFYVENGVRHCLKGGLDKYADAARRLLLIEQSFFQTLKHEAKEKAKIKQVKMKLSKLEKAINNKLKQDDEKVTEQDGDINVIVKPGPADFMTDLAKAFSGRTIDSNSLEFLVQSNRLSECSNSMLNPAKMAALKQELNA